MLKSTPQDNATEAPAVSELALRTLFDAEESPLLRYAFSLTGRRAVAEEIVQDAFLQLHARWHEVESPRSWLFKCVCNRAYNYIRDNQREILHGDDRLGECPDSDDETPEAALVRLEITEAVRRLVDKLDAPDRELVRLKYFEDLKYREISVRTGLTVSNVGYRLHHILKGLAAKLHSLGIDGKP